ncbi:MAG: hypothetical protein CMJ45_11700 [Planctomyces sp.]|nr:hypothetical protein [Planctomyces sp.]
MQATDQVSAMVNLIKSESERIMGYFDSLSPGDLEKPSPCERWTVGEVIAHLVWHVETYRGMMERGLRDDLSPTEGLPSVPAGTPNRQVIVDESYGQAAIDRRRTLGRDLILSFTEEYGKLNTLLAAVVPEDWSKPCYHVAGLRSVESFLLTYLMELAVHEWDIRSTREPSPIVSEEIMPLMMDRIPGKLGRPWSITFPDMTDTAGSVVYRFNLSGVGATDIDVVVEDNRARAVPAKTTPANFSIGCDTDTFVLLMYGRFSLESAVAAGRMTTEGDEGLMTGFDQWLAGH